MDNSTSDEHLMSESKEMNQPNFAKVKLTDTQLDVFRVLYPIFKDEIFRRREQMMRLTAFASALLLLILVTLIAMTPSLAPMTPTRWFAMSGVALFSGLFAYLILQHANRHRMAKQQLIALEQSLGLYQDGWQPNGDALFPTNWQSDWVTDRSVTIYLTVLATLTALVICAMLIRA